MVDRVKPWFMVHGSGFCSWFRVQGFVHGSVYGSVHGSVHGLVHGLVHGS